jgi:hypothetical protein
MRAQIEDGVYATETPVLIDKGITGPLYAGGKFGCVSRAGHCACASRSGSESGMPVVVVVKATSGMPVMKIE